MTERISYDDLAAFFSSHYGSSCETMRRIDRVYQDSQINYLQCTTSAEGLSTFTITLPEYGMNSFADIRCLTHSPDASNPAIMCSADNDGESIRGSAFQLALMKSNDESLNAIGGFIYADSPNLVFGRAWKLLDYLSSVDFGWYWVTEEGNWYSKECGIWNML